MYAGSLTTVTHYAREQKTSPDAYVVMIEENEIRSYIRFYEWARVVVKALERACSDSKQALQTLFSNISRAKRSKIKSLMTLADTLNSDLHLPSAVRQRVGLELAKQLTEDPHRVDVIKSRLAQDFAK
mgnify:CR=1 FL=1